MRKHGMMGLDTGKNINIVDKSVRNPDQRGSETEKGKDNQRRISAGAQSESSKTEKRKYL